MNIELLHDSTGSIFLAVPFIIIAVGNIRDMGPESAFMFDMENSNGTKFFSIREGKMSILHA